MESRRSKKSNSSYIVAAGAWVLAISAGLYVDNKINAEDDRREIAEVEQSAEPIAMLTREVVAVDNAALQTAGIGELVSSSQFEQATLPAGERAEQAENDTPDLRNPRATRGPTAVLKRFMVSTHSSDTLAQKVEFLGGQMSTQLGQPGHSSSLHLIYLPENKVEELSRDGDFLIAEDKVVSAASSLSLTNNNGKNNAKKHQAVGNPGKKAGGNLVPAVGVAVLDTGVSQHADLNIASQYEVVTRARAEALREEFDDAYAGEQRYHLLELYLG